jgi:putative thioredoxin
VLERLETAYAGRFTLAKLNSDEQPDIASQLSQMFGVRSIPFCVLFKGGQPVDGFVGALPEAEIRAFLDRHVPSAEAAAAADDVVEAQALLAEGDTDSALERLQEAIAINPANDAARFDYLRALLGAGHIEEARRAYEPVASKVMLDARLSAAGHWLAACEQAAQARSPDELAAAIAADRRDFGARFELAQQHFAAQRFTQAMDELLEIVMRDKAWRDELARKTYVAILELMKPSAPAAAVAAAPQGKVELTGKAAAAPSDPVVDAYRRKLSMALF